MAAKIGRNDPCHCGSGKKYKHCHAIQDEGASPARRLVIAAVIVIFVATLALAINSAMNQTDAPGRVWDPEHGHYHDY